MTPLARSTLYLASDVHWQPSAPGAPAPLGLFGRFLEALASEARARDGVRLYILGDLFDYWLERDGRSFPFYDAHLAALQGAREAGVELTLLFGNRDFTYGDVLPAQVGATVAGDRAVVAVGDKRVLLEHGDLLCTLDWRYQLYRRVVRSRVARAAASRVSLERMARVIAGMRRASRAEIERKPVAALEIVDAAVARRLDEGFDAVVCGHVHRPSRRPVRAGTRTGELVTLGSWEAHEGWYACDAGGELALEPFSA